jgi:hypothetical protein
LDGWVFDSWQEQDNFYLVPNVRTSSGAHPTSRLVITVSNIEPLNFVG